jgi:hypothetical protein
MECFVCAACGKPLAAKPWKRYQRKLGQVNFYCNTRCFGQGYSQRGAVRREERRKEHEAAERERANRRVAFYDLPPTRPATLHSRWWEILQQRAGGSTLGQIAQQLGITPARVRQIEIKAFHRLHPDRDFDYQRSLAPWGYE